MFRKFHLFIFILLTLAVVLLLENATSPRTVIVVATVFIYGILSYLLGYRTRS